MENAVLEAPATAPAVALVVSAATIYECEDCVWKGSIDDMAPISNPEERVAVGEFHPAGQCPSCGSLIGVADADIPDYTLENAAQLLKARGWTVEKPVTDGTQKPDVVPVANWDSQVYGGSIESAKSFLVQIGDHRAATGQVHVDLQAEGNIDDIMCVSMEVHRLPETETDVQCLHLSFDGDNHAASIFKQGDRYIIRPEFDVMLSKTTLANGDDAWILE